MPDKRYVGHVAIHFPGRFKSSGLRETPFSSEIRIFSVRYLRFAFLLCKKRAGRSEHVLKRKLDAFNSDYVMLQMQSEELRVRSVQGQIKMAV